MSTHDTDERTYEHLQADDRTDIDTVVDSLHDKYRRKKEAEERREHAAKLRRVINVAKKSLGQMEADELDDLLLTAHWLIRERPELRAVLDPAYEGLDNAAQVRFREHMQLRENGERPPSAKEELKTLGKVAEALSIISSMADTSQYAPVRLEPLDEGDPDDAGIQAFGRRRFGHDSVMTREEATVNLSTTDCDHFLTIARPRAGKDSTNVRVCQSLKEDVGYKIVSTHDDGRNETLMWAIPSDDDGILKSLDRMGQNAKAYNTTVWIPDMGNIPDYLPANFQRFSISVADLSPELVLRLVGITETSPNVESRIEAALNETVQERAGVQGLTAKLEEYAEELTGTFEYTYKGEGDEVGDGDLVAEEISVEMPEADALNEAAQQLTFLAGKGLIRPTGADTNIDMEEVISDQDSVAVLNCNYLSDGDAGLKYTIIDIWLQMIFRVRDDEDAYVPRVATEVREIKNLCPSKRSDAKYWEQIQPLRSTFFELATQGGSRGICIVGSTQKVTDMYKSIRSNMIHKIILNLDPEGTKEIGDKYGLNHDQRQQIRHFTTGQGMVITNGDPFYPIEFCGAKCGLGEKDQRWRDRYGWAFGARVLGKQDTRENWRDGTDAENWVRVRDGRVFSVEERRPQLGEWYLLPGDIEAGVEALREHVDAAGEWEDVCDSRDTFDIRALLAENPEYPSVEEYAAHVLGEDDSETDPDAGDVGGENAAAESLPSDPTSDVIPVDLPDHSWEDLAAGADDIDVLLRRIAMWARREHEIPSDLMLRPSGVSAEQRTLTLRKSSEEDDLELQRALRAENVPDPLIAWKDTPTSTRENYLEILRLIEQNEFEYQKDIVEAGPVSAGPVSTYLNETDRLAECVRNPKEADSTDVFELTAVGKRALHNVDWARIDAVA